MSEPLTSIEVSAAPVDELIKRQRFWPIRLDRFEQVFDLGGVMIPSPRGCLDVTDARDDLDREGSSARSFRSSRCPE